MTFEEMLAWPEKIEAMTDAQIEAAVAPYFPVTRPANLSTAAAATDESDMDPTIAAKLAALRAAAAPKTVNLLKK